MSALGICVLPGVGSPMPHTCTRNLVSAVPSGATALAHSDVSPQAFRMGRTLAVQFHPEVTEAVVRHWTSGDGATELTKAGIDRDELLTRTSGMVDEMRGRTDSLVGWFLRDVAQTHES